MEKAVLKTIAYFDIFNYPLKAWEIHKWLTQKKSNLKQLERVLKKIVGEKRISEYHEFYSLKPQRILIKKRLEREQISKERLLKAKLVGSLIKTIPWIELAGITGSLSMLSSSKKDDIDLFIITSKNRIWITRLLLVFLISLTGLRRKRREKLLSASGKICVNLILEVDNLAQKNKNIYVAHEVLQMRPLWQRDAVYSKFLHDNQWVFKYLPNWKSGTVIQNSKFKIQNYNSKVKSSWFFDLLEKLAKKFQLKVMGNPDRFERIENGALYFHPEDKGVKILEEYKKRMLEL